jgi:glycosyltransferase involved in cell wall biosynthesis
MLVSAIIPTYNRAKTIERAVISVLAQSWKEMEVIVVDDGSTDQTRDVLRGYGDKIRVIFQKNAGPAAARNTGIKAAKGEIISFLDSDDAWLATKTERQVKLFQRAEASGVVCCVCNARMHFLSGRITSFESAKLHPVLSEGVWSNPAEILIDRFLFFNQVAAVRREALFEAGLFREDLPFGLNDDYDLAVRLSLVGPWAFIVDPLVEWYEHVDNISRTHRQQAICATTLRILQDIGNSTRFRPMLPQARYNRRLRLLRFGLCAMRLKAHKNPALQLMGRAMVAYQWGFETLRSRIVPPARMLTQNV